MRKITLSRSKESAWFLLELLGYAAFVVAYYFLVLHFLGGWLKHLFDEQRMVYAATALALITIQGVVLEFFTAWLFNLVRPKGQLK